MISFKKTRYKGLSKHFTSAAIIKKGDKYLLIDRRKKPFGWAPLAGHVDQGESAREALDREIKEEGNLKISSARLLLRETVNFGCRRIGSYHEVNVYLCKVSGKLKLQREEIKRACWFSVKEMRKLKIEPLWKYLFKRLKILE